MVPSSLTITDCFFAQRKYTSQQTEHEIMVKIHTPNTIGATSGGRLNSQTGDVGLVVESMAMMPRPACRHDDASEVWKFERVCASSALEMSA